MFDPLTVLENLPATDCNENLLQNIEIDNEQTSRNLKDLGFKIRGKDIYIADLLNVLEDMDIPDLIQDQYPELTGEEWSAITRLVTLMFLGDEWKHLDWDKLGK